MIGLFWINGHHEVVIPRRGNGFGLAQLAWIVAVGALSP